MVLNTRAKAIIITIGAALIALLLGAGAPLGKLVWPARAVAPADEPNQVQLVGFILVYAWQSLGFGAGIAFLFLGYPRIAQLTDTRGLARATHLAIAWMLINWVPHVNLHMHVGEDPSGLLAIEWGFHATLIMAGLVLAMFFLRVTKSAKLSRSDAGSTPPAARDTAA